jgi:hypothetical protein
MNRDANAQYAVSYVLVLCMGILAMAGGCASAVSFTREKDLKDEGEQQPQEKEAFRIAAEQYLRDTKELRRNGLTVVLVAGKDPVVPRPECTDYGCPTAVMCEAVKAVCYVTHCGKGNCRLCPEPMPEAFRNIVFRQWCSFECARGPLRIGTAIGFVPSIGRGFIGPFGCPTEEPPHAASRE